MSLFVGNLAFVENIQYMDGVKIGVSVWIIIINSVRVFFIVNDIKKMISLNKIYALLIILITIMFSFSNKASAEYDKLIYDFEIESITGEKIDFSKYKNKDYLISKCCKSSVVLQNNMQIYKNYGKHIKIKV